MRQIAENEKPAFLAYAMYTKKFGREATEAVLAKVYTGPTEFTKDVDAVSQLKTELVAGMLE